MTGNGKKFNIEPSRKGFVTSYPPFRLWKKTVVKEMLTEKPINIYVHLPFCMQRCAYCYYMTISLKEKPDIDRYVEAVCREIEIASKHFHLKSRPVVSIYFGGGTPTLIKKSQLFRLIDCLHENLSVNEPEFTIEAEPLTLTEKKADILRKLNVNRLSIGVQSFYDDIIKLSGRGHTEKQALKAIEIARKTSDWVINIDLLSGLAGEIRDTWSRTVERALSTDVESVTIYKMEAYSNTGFAKDVLKNEMRLPNESEELEFIRFALSMLKSNHYLPWCFFTFTKNGQFPNIYASSIWKGGDLYGFGASSFGAIGQYLFQNHINMSQYMKYVEEGDLPIWRGSYLTSVDEIVRGILLGMKLTQINISEFQKRHGVNLTDLCSDTLDELVNDGYVIVEGSSIRMTPKGILYGDYVGKCLAMSASIKLGMVIETKTFTETYLIWS